MMPALATAVFLVRLVTPVADAAPQSQTAPAAQRALLLPVNIPRNAPRELTAALPGIETALRQGLARHGGLTIVSHVEIARLAGTLANQQLTGCDAEGCMALLGEAVGARYIVATNLELADGLWILRAALLDRESATAARRTVIRARTLQGLLGSLDLVSRQLSVGRGLSVDDPQLAQRLGTSPEMAAELAKRVRQAPPGHAPDVAETWTDIIIEHNAERSVFPLGVATGLLVAAGALGGAFLCTPVILTPIQAASDPLRPSARAEDRPDPVNPDGTYNFPWLALGIFYLNVVPVMLAAGMGLAFSFLFAVLDALDLGRIQVSKQGCCRNDERIRQAESPSWLHRAATLAVAGAGVLVLFTPILGAGASLVLGVLASPFKFDPGPTVPISRAGWTVATAAGAFLASGMLMSVLLGTSGLAMLSAAGLIASERVSMLE